MGVVASASLGTSTAATGGVPLQSTSAFSEMPLSQRVCTYVEWRSKFKISYHVLPHPPYFHIKLSKITLYSFHTGVSVLHSL